MTTSEPMIWLLRRGERGPVHRSVQEGGGGMVIMQTACGVWVRWDQPHAPWQRARNGSTAAVTCKRCRP